MQYRHEAEAPIITKRIRARRSLRELKESANRGLRAWGVAFGKPEVAERLCSSIAPKRTRRPAGVGDRPLERDVLKVIVQALRLDRRVARVERNQSGVFQEGNRFVRVGHRGKPDLTVFLKDGKYLAIEVKRDEREIPKPYQLERLAAIRASGGLAGWAWSVESALALLP